MVKGALLVLIGVLLWAAEESAGAFELRSQAFSSGGAIPIKYTCDGSDLSPPLRWSDPPPNTIGFALTVDDPDAHAGTWIHWVLYRIPATARELPEGVETQDTVPQVGTQGMNDFRKVGYSGPCPPRGPGHRYFFKLHALDIELTLPPRKTKADILKVIEGHVLGEANLMGRYGRK